MSNPFEAVNHDEYDPAEDQMDDSDNPDPAQLSIRFDTDPEVDDAP